MLRENYLELLGRMPFVDRAELAAMLGVSVDTVGRSVRRLERAGLATSLSHATAYGRASARYFLTGSGIDELAAGIGTEVSGLRDRYPASRRWRRALLARLDAVAAVYRFVASLGASLDAGPVLLDHWMRGPLEATARFGGGAVVGVMRKGLAVSQRSFERRAWRVARSGWGHRIPIVALAQSDLERDYLAAGSLGRLFNLRFLVGYEYEAFDFSGGEPRLRASFGEDRKLGVVSEWAEVFQSGREAPDFGRAWRWSASDDVLLAPERGIRSESVSLSLIEKRLIDLVYDWPLSSRRAAAAALSVTERRLRSAAGRLEAAGLLRADRENGDRFDRFVLTDRAIEYVGGRDRVYPAYQKRSLSGEPVQNGHDYRGSALRAAVRELDHHDGLGEFLSRMRSDRTESFDWLEIEPTRRSTRSFRFNGRAERLTADALVRLSLAEGTKLTLMVEYERRASRPSSISAKIRPYRRYFESGAAAGQMGPDCLVAFVFERQEQETLLAMRLAEDRKRQQFSVPVISTVTDRLDQNGGPYGQVWRIAGDLDGLDPRRLDEIRVVRSDESARLVSA